jgi:hypothetical protein
MENLTARLSKTDEAILISVAGMINMDAGDFLSLAGRTLCDALSGIYTVMSKDPDLRRQVHEIAQLRMAGDITETEMAAMLQEIGDMAGG